MAAEGWEYVRAETLPSEERSGLAGRNTVYHNVLVFRRERRADAQLRIAASNVSAPGPAEVEPGAALSPSANTAS